MPKQLNLRHKITVEQIDACAHMLKPTYLAALRASLVEPDYPSMAKALGIEKIGTLKSRLNRARAALKVALGPPFRRHDQ